MKLKLAGSFLIAMMTIAIPAAAARGQASFKMGPIGGAVMTPDNKTLIVSITTEAKLAFFDTVNDKEIKKVEMDYQPTVLAIQGKKLIVATKGSPILRVLELDTLKEIKAIKLPGEGVQSIACHPEKGLVYAVNLQHEVFAVDLVAGTGKKTAAKGQLIAVDSVDGKSVYTGIQEPMREQLVFQERGGRVMVSLMKANQNALMLKYSVNGSDLKLVGLNDNAASNGRGMGLSSDGKLIAMAGGGGWRSKTDPKVTYAVAVFDTTDMKTIVGLVETGAYPGAVSFHPVLKIGAAYQANPNEPELHIFNKKSCAVKEKFKMEKDNSGGTAVLMFGGQGTKVICGSVGLRNNKEAVLEFFPLTLTDSDKEALKAAYP